MSDEMDDPFAEPAGPGTDDAPADGGQQGSENSTVRELRAAIERAEKREKALVRENQTLTEFKDTVVGQQRDAAIAKVFTDAGLNPKHATLFKTLNPDLTPDGVTPDVVSKFASDYELPTSEGKVPDAPAPEEPGFTPPPTVPRTPSTRLTNEDVSELLAKGEIEAVTAAYREGRVEKEEVPWTQYAGA